MDRPSPKQSAVKPPASTVPRVLVATTAMLTFITFWRAAAVVLNDLASSAFYACGIAEQAIGKSAPWFILAVMLFAYAVMQMYVESCSMFVRGGVYRVVKEAMGGTLAKFSVSALMFDYILTGPISGVSAGQYLAGFTNELLHYAHINITLPTNSTAAFFAAAVTIYFWWQNTKGIEESSEKAATIMKFTTAMVVLIIVWCGYTLWIQGGHLPPTPRPENLHFSPEAEGWLHSSRLPELIGVVGILVAFGHSVLAMSGLETLAQVYREIQHPKLPNLKKTALIIFIYSLLFTSLVSFFAYAIIPDATRLEFKDNLIGGLAMHVAGPTMLKLLFHAFVVVVGIMILSGAVNTAIVGSNGVLNRVSEDGVLTDWFRHPHPRFGTSHRIINLVVILQLLTIFLSRGNVILLGEAYAFGVMWSFAMKGLAVLVLRYKDPGEREFRVPLNLRIGRLDIPIGLGLITLTLLAVATVNLFTKQIATTAGIAFTLVFFGIFTASEHYTHRRRSEVAEMDQFHLEPGAEITPKTVGCRAGSILVLARDLNTLYHLAAVLDRVNPRQQDVVVLHIRILRRAGSGEHALVPEQLFTAREQMLFTQALAIAEKKGKRIYLAVAAATEIWDGILRSAESLQAATIVLGASAKMPVTEQARRAGLAWEGLSDPKPHLALEIFTPTGQEDIFYLGPHAPHLTLKEIDLLHQIWLRFSNELGPEELHHHDIIHFALREIELEIAQGKGSEVLERLRQHLNEIQSRRVPHL
ncbi:MAG: APC family permease [Acidobacteriia bacterium]|nr:APC family permease [Terriglobia bacterium]